MKSTIILTVHNKADILREYVLPALAKYTDWSYSDLIVVLDGCTDNSENEVHYWAHKESFNSINDYRKIQIIRTPDVFETKANNAGIRLAEGEYVIILQDDIVVNELGWNRRITEPFLFWKDVFAVSGNCAHNWKINDDRSPTGEVNGWSDLLLHIDHANKHNTARNDFKIRDCVNRGPLAINRADLETLGLFDEQAIYKQDMDDHDLCYRMHKKLGKVVGFYPVEWLSQSEWGGTRDENGKPKAWLLDAQKKNMQLVYERHRDIIHTHNIKTRTT